MSDFFKEESAPPKDYVVDATAVRGLYYRDTTKGARNRKLLKATLPVSTYDSFINFLEKSAGGSVHKGNGIGSPMVAIALKLLMAVVSKFRVEDAVSDLEYVVFKDKREGVAENLNEIARRLN